MYFLLNDFLELGSTGVGAMTEGGNVISSTGGDTWIGCISDDEGGGSFETTISEAGEAIVVRKNESKTLQNS